MLPFRFANRIPHVFQYPISYLDLLVLLSFSCFPFSIHDSHNL
ncbi:hypothetical protein EMIT074MI3_20810 [Bacillus licheniformis]